MRVSAPLGAVLRGLPARRATPRGAPEKGEGEGKTIVPSDLALQARRRFPRRPRRSSGFSFPRLLALPAAALPSARPPPKLGPRARSRLAGNPPCRFARRLRQPPAAAVAGLVDAPLRLSRSRPGIPGREAQVPRAVRAPCGQTRRAGLSPPPAPTACRPLSRSTRPRLPCQVSFRLRRSSSFPTARRLVGDPPRRLARRLRRTACRPLSRAIKLNHLGQFQYYTRIRNLSSPFPSQF